MRASQFARDEAGGLVEGITSPVRGLNTQSPLSGLSTDYAIKLDNFVCQPDAIVSRKGAANHATGFAQNPRTLMQYAAGSTKLLFAAASNGIFDVSAAVPVGAAVATITNGQGKSVNFSTSADSYLYFVNGVDSPQLRSSAVWTAITGVSAPAITGPTTSTFFDVEAYRQRLFFLANNFLGFYYLPSDSVGGAATAFRVGSLCRRGGRVIGHGTWSIDGGSGPDDLYVVVTSEGEIIAWRGNDPGTAANWVYIGTFYVGKPFNQNCLVKFGGDLLYLCENGLIPLSTLLVSTTRDYSASLTARIQPTIMAAAAAYGTLPGWKVHVIPRLNLILINVPTTSTTSIQYVYNTLSKGWSTFSGYNAFDFAEFGVDTYYSTVGKVVKALAGTSDFGNDIVAVCDTAYNRFKTRLQLKPILMRVLHASQLPVSYTVGIAQDFTDLYAETTYGASTGTAGLWNTGLWNAALWGGNFLLRRDWVTPAAVGGISLSTRFKVSSKTTTTLLLAVDYKFTQQGLVS